MEEVSSLAPSFDDAYESLTRDIRNLRREVAAIQLMDFPGREWMAAQAVQVMESTGASGVEINALAQHMQYTIVKVPLDKTMHLKPVPDVESLCVLTVGAARPLAAYSLTALGHPAGDRISAWASAPIFVDGLAAGTICVLEDQGPRHWDDHDEMYLVTAAALISGRIQSWLREM